MLKPGGEIVLVNHFGQADGPLARVEAAVAPLCSRIGWSSDFKVARVEAWARAAGLAEVVEVEAGFSRRLLQAHAHPQGRGSQVRGPRRRFLTPSRRLPYIRPASRTPAPARGGVAQLVRAEES